MAIWHKQVWSSIDSAVDNPDVLALHRLWSRLQGGQPGHLPSLAALSMEGPLAPFAARMTAYEALPDGDYLGRYCGEQFRHDARGDPTGQRLSQQEPEIAAFQRDHFNQAAQRGQAVYVLHASHTNPWVLTWERLVMPVRADDGRPWVLVFNDPLESRARLLETVLDSASDAILTLRSLRDPLGVQHRWLITVANRAFARLGGCTLPNLRGHLVHESVPLWEQLGLEADCRAVVQTRQPCRRELEQRRGEGSQWYSVHIDPLLDGCVLRLTDITASKDKEHALLADNAELRQLAWQDGLTGLLNRRALDVILEREVARALRLSEPLAVVMCDIDHFKAFNDFYGHLIGDDCLREVGQVLGGVIQRATDMVARYGGEEFTLVLPNTRLTGGLDLVQRIQQALHDRGLPDATSPNGKLLTLSFGVAEFDPRRDPTAHAFMQRADSALYRAKHQGRNRVGLAHAQDIEVLESTLTLA
ncbi:diguanylate cyclase [Curvibacter sp. HBC28]|uniref:diguanylate cyclase n=1 Tax=Curvibacter microcysteis TaxID=3026419 RepID=A0ABT5MBD3_9BURK|nr:sensor domain-containing diguanylate cyclase [Curvibacter sp. HBC28]MDD0813878.1 diguanylate cyclase [Curvibacter sp. HBC28]